MKGQIFIQFVVLDPYFVLHVSWLWWGGTPFLSPPDGPSLIFYHSDFWKTFLPWKTELPWNFSLCWNIFYLSALLSNLCLPWKTERVLNSLYWIYIFNFNHSEFWTACACPEKQSLPWNFSLRWNIFYLSGFLRNLRLPWKRCTDISSRVISSRDN